MVYRMRLGFFIEYYNELVYSYVMQLHCVCYPGMQLGSNTNKYQYCIAGNICGNLTLSFAVQMRMARIDFHTN